MANLGEASNAPALSSPPTNRDSQLGITQLWMNSTNKLFSMNVQDTPLGRLAQKSANCLVAALHARHLLGRVTKNDDIT